MNTKAKIIFIFSMFICTLSYSQKDFQRLLIKQKDFCGFGDFYFNNVFVGYDETFVIRTTIDSLTSFNNLKEIIVKSKRLGISSILEQTFDSTGNILFKDNTDTKAKCLKIEYDESGRLKEIEKESFISWTEKESYNYDLDGRLIEINTELIPVQNDTSDGFHLICLSLPNKWIGEYDTSGNLIKSQTHWDSGKIYTQDYHYLTGKLKTVKYETLDGKKMTKEFTYKDGLLESIVYFNQKNRKLKTEHYFWEMVNKD